jgi:transposase
MSRPIAYPVTLTDEQRERLRQLVRRGSSAARTITRGRILLLMDQGVAPAQIGSMLDIGGSTIWRVCKRFSEEGLEIALAHKPPRVKKPRRLDGRAEARLIQLACSPPPDGRDRWTLQLLADRLIELKVVPHVVPETIRKTLKKTNSPLIW